MQIGLLSLILVFGAQLASANTLRVLTDRPKDRVEKAMQGFTEMSGVQVEIVSRPYAELKELAKVPGESDLLLLKDLTFLADAADNQLFQAMNAPNMRLRVAPFMRDPGGLWTAITYRIRTIAFDPSVVPAQDLSTYESLARPEFKGRLCMRNAKEYMPAMTAWMITRYGEAKAEAILRGWSENLAEGFTDGDSVSLKKINEGSCAASVVNQYYLARLKNADKRFPVSLNFADQFEGGLHTNGFGGGIVKGTKNSANANILLGYLLSHEGQAALVAEPSFEYPANSDFKPVEIVENFGTFKASDLSWKSVAANLNKANALLDKVGWAK